VTWLPRYHLRHFVATSFWFVPGAGDGGRRPSHAARPLARYADAMALVRLQRRGRTGHLERPVLVDADLHRVRGVRAAARSQIASGQLTPRIISLVFARPMLRISVGVFVFAYAFTLAALGRIETVRVPELLVTVAVLLTLVSIAVFFWFVQQLGTGLRPVFILQSLWDTARGVVDRVYPDLLNAGGAAAAVAVGLVGNVSPRIILHVGASGTFLAFGQHELVALARSAGCVLELIPQVGDFVAHGDPLFRIHPGSARVNERALYHCVAFGYERTLEQDPAFAFRIMVDIASRALSPAVNDPTTAVLAIDQIHRLLAHLGQRDLDTGPMRDAHGQVRLVYATPNWEDFVTLAVSEIRSFGAGSIQIPRRLSAMFEHLLEVLRPAARRPCAGSCRSWSARWTAVCRRRGSRERAGSDRQGLGGSAASATHTSD